MVGSEGLDGDHVLYSLLYTTASLPMMLGPRAQALSYHVPTKYLFLPNSQAQSLEIPYLWNTKKDKIKREGLYQEVSKGGFRMVDTEIMFKALNLA